MDLEPSREELMMWGVACGLAFAIFVGGMVYGFIKLVSQ